MNKALILFASLKEANSLIYQSNINFIKKSSREYISDKINIYITGIGKKSIDKLKKNNFNGSDLIIKAGIAAVIDPEIKLLKPFIPKKIIYKDTSIIIKSKIEYLNFTDKTLMTVEKPLMNKKKSHELCKNGISFIDMETFFIMERVNNPYLIPLLVGTDYGDENAKRDFKLNLPAASLILKDEILNIIDLSFR